MWPFSSSTISFVGLGVIPRDIIFRKRGCSAKPRRCPTSSKARNCIGASPLTLIAVLIAWFVMSRTLSGYQVRVVGLAPAAARLGGFSENRTVLMTMLVSGALAGLAGLIECSATFGQLTPQFPVNYGFTAIIVAFLGRLHPIGVLIGGVGARDLLYRRRYRPDRLRPAAGRDGADPGDDAVLPARRRHLRGQPGAASSPSLARHAS